MDLAPVQNHDAAITLENGIYVVAAVLFMRETNPLQAETRTCGYPWPGSTRPG